MNKLSRYFVLSLSLSASLLLSQPACAEIAVIINLNSPIAKMPTEQAAQYYIGKASDFTPIEQAKDSPIRREFHEKVTTKTEPQLQAIWARIEFSGKGSSPRAMSSDADVKKAVAADAKAIGYINKSAVDGSVKVLLTLP